MALHLPKPTPREVGERFRLEKCVRSTRVQRCEGEEGRGGWRESGVSMRDAELEIPRPPRCIPLPPARLGRLTLCWWCVG